jgi:hypothetical protein
MLDKYMGLILDVCVYIFMFYHRPIKARWSRPSSLCQAQVAFTIHPSIDRMIPDSGFYLLSTIRNSVERHRYGHSTVLDQYSPAERTRRSGVDSRHRFAHCP